MTHLKTELDVDYLRGWIGRTDKTSEVLTGTAIDRFNATFDREFATKDGSTAPVLFHFCLCQPAVPTAELGPDGHPAKGGFIPPVPLPRRMWAGSEMTFHDDLRVGDTVTRTSVIDDVVVKEGRSGTLCFVTVTHRFGTREYNAITDRQTIVYRSAETANTKADTPAAAPPPASAQRTVTPSPPLLFRYSALTFNSHRIHYDTPYVTADEGYPGLMVHGPLQATLLAQFAADLRDAKLSAFKFRGISPLFAPSDFTINARDDGDDMTLWSARGDGSVAMQATAKW